jgi:hypothetical protein
MAKQIGFWKGKVRNCPDLRWFKSDEYQACLKYLQAGRKHRGYKGWANCRICGACLGTYDMITPDKKWIFPEEYDHYLTEHKLKPNKLQFIEDAVKWNRI